MLMRARSIFGTKDSNNSVSNTCKIQNFSPTLSSEKYLYVLLSKAKELIVVQVDKTIDSHSAYVQIAEGVFILINKDIAEWDYVPQCHLEVAKAVVHSSANTSASLILKLTSVDGVRVMVTDLGMTALQGVLKVAAAVAAVNTLTEIGGFFMLGGVIVISVAPSLLAANLLFNLTKSLSNDSHTSTGVAAGGMVGSLAGGYMGVTTAVNAGAGAGISSGLTSLGGGALAAGGYGILGGLVVVSGIGLVATVAGAAIVGGAVHLRERSRLDQKMQYMISRATSGGFCVRIGYCIEIIRTPTSATSASSDGETSEDPLLQEDTSGTKEELISDKVTANQHQRIYRIRFSQLVRLNTRLAIDSTWKKGIRCLEDDAAKKSTTATDTDKNYLSAEIDKSSSPSEVDLLSKGTIEEGVSSPPSSLLITANKTLLEAVQVEEEQSPYSSNGGVAEEPCLAAWAMLHDLSKLQDASRGLQVLESVLHSLGVEEATDLTLLDREDVERVAELLKKVPRKKFQALFKFGH